MTALADRIDRLTAAIGRAVAWLVLAVVLLQFALVVARYLFGLGSVWLTETVIYAHAAVFMLAAAWTLQPAATCGSIFSTRMPRRAAKALVDLAGALLLLLPFMLVLFWLSVPYAARSWAILEHSQETSGLPLVFVLKTLIPLFALLMALARHRAGDPRRRCAVEGALMLARRDARDPDGDGGRRRADGRLSGRADARRRIAGVRSASAMC